LKDQDNQAFLAVARLF